MTSKIDPERESEAMEFLQQTMGTTYSDSFYETLKTGIVLCEFLNKLQPGLVKKINKRTMPFMCMENIENYITATQTLGIPHEYSFMTVDLYDEKNLAQVALSIIAVKRHFGHGFEKRTGGSQVSLDMGEDNTTNNEVERAPQEETNFERRGELSRTGTAKRPGILQLTDPQQCPVCTVPITHSCFTALGKTWHKECFNCRKCGQNLRVFYDWEDAPYCDRCILIVNPQKNVRGITKEQKLFNKN